MKKLAGIVLALVVSVPVMAQQTKPEAEANAEALAKQLSNPVADLVSVPLQLNFLEGVGPYNELSFVMKVQPVVPFHLTKDWNLIGRMIFPYINQPSLTSGDPTATAAGTGDIVASAFFSPVKVKDGLV